MTASAGQRLVRPVVTGATGFVGNALSASIHSVQNVAGDYGIP